MQENRPLRTIQPVALRCLECRRMWVEPMERWRVYLSGEDRSQPLTYCPDCAQREFD